jgi:hypothetical protein
MKNFKNIVAAITLTVIIASSATFANAGLLVSDLTSNTPTCQADPGKGEKVNSGILVSDIIMAALTGIVVARSMPSEGPVNCGIVVA